MIKIAQQQQNANTNETLLHVGMMLLTPKMPLVRHLYREWYTNIFIVFIEVLLVYRGGGDNNFIRRWHIRSIFSQPLRFNVYNDIAWKWFTMKNRLGREIEIALQSKNER